MNFDFTLLCFAKCFNLNYSRSAINDFHLKCFFANCEYMGFDDYIKGKVDPIKNLIPKINSSLSQELLDMISDTDVHNVFSHVIGNDLNLNKSNMLYELLTYACNFPKDVQKNIFEQRNESDFANYIATLKSNKENKIIQMDTCELLEKAISNDLGIGELVGIDMAFHCGSLWQVDPKRFNLLKKIIETNVKLRVLINSKAEIGNFSEHLSITDVKQLDIDKCVEAWLEFAKKYPDFVEVRIAKVPLFRSFYFFKGKEKKIARIRDYHMGFCVYDIPPKCYNDSLEEYQILLKEYEYIWNISLSDNC